MSYLETVVDDRAGRVRYILLNRIASKERKRMEGRCSSEVLHKSAEKSQGQKYTAQVVKMQLHDSSYMYIAT